MPSINENASDRPTRKKPLGRIAVLVLLILVPLSAVIFLGSWTVFFADSRVLSSSDDPLNGLQILDPALSNAQPKPIVADQSNAQDETAVMLQNWNFTPVAGFAEK